MMSKPLTTTLLCAALSVSAMAVEPTQIGVGVGLSDSSTTLRLPINLDSTLRIEPEFGFSFQNADNNDYTNILAGAGLYLMQQPSEKINLYYGGKMLVDYKSYDRGTGFDDSETQLVLGAAFGFEYMFDRHFSAGGEAGAYLGFGDATNIETQGLALLRYYF